jgi:hypothetical protein
MFLLRAETIEQLRALCEIDPKHANGARSHRSRLWMRHQGSLALRVSFSDQRAQILQQPPSHPLGSGQTAGDHPFGHLQEPLRPGLDARIIGAALGPAQIAQRAQGDKEVQHGKVGGA